MLTKQTVVTWHTTPAELRKLADDMEVCIGKAAIGGSVVIHKTWGKDGVVLEVAFDQSAPADDAVAQSVKYYADNNIACQCGEPISQDSCPKCGIWHDLHGRR